ncbi:MAG TPA: hypothetical protein VMU97_01070 [Candidatus Dormibacteraeota bacterium]|nr:hypothetical protein [Candidatus Dormibacteraeota bacterium]
MSESYEKSEEDIEVALRYLKFHDPENATREQAIALLEDLQSGFHSMAHHDPQQLLELQKKIDANKHSEKPENS